MCSSYPQLSITTPLYKKTKNLNLVRNKHRYWIEFFQVNNEYFIVFRRIIHEHAENPVYGCSIEDRKETKEISGTEHGFSLLMGTNSILVR